MFSLPTPPLRLAQDLIFIHAFNKNLLDIFLIPGPVLRAGDAEIKQTLAPLELKIDWVGADSKINILYYISSSKTSYEVWKTERGGNLGSRVGEE